MSEHLHPGIHPDADSLNAFVEGVLPEHERLACVAHLADCARCREVVFEAQEPVPAPVVIQLAPVWKRWFAPVPVFAAAAALSVAALVLWWSAHRGAEVPKEEMAEHVQQTPPTQARGPVPPVPQIAKTPELPIRKRGPHTPKADQAVASAKAKPVFIGDNFIPPIDPVDPGPPTLPAPPEQVTVTASALPISPPVVPPAPGIELRETRAAAGISGTVIDPAGAIIPGATVSVRQLEGTLTANARTGADGNFSVAQLPAGRYEVRIGAPGFREYITQVDVRALEVASLKSQLQLGSVTESVEVTAAASTTQTVNASMSTVSRKKALPRPLPSKLPAISTVASGKTLLAIDEDGALFVSRNSGKKWKKVKTVWQGDVDSIALAGAPTDKRVKFQLTTEPGAVWLSRDGSRWTPAPAQR